uniref:Uncharacterized protein n=1 Tax=Cacopsylla melanoneura TaxID=428564 RepID=A0A8D9FEZ3_9HEMI
MDFSQKEKIAPGTSGLLLSYLLFSILRDERPAIKELKSLCLLLFQTLLPLRSVGYLFNPTTVFLPFPGKFPDIRERFSSSLADFIDCFFVGDSSTILLIFQVPNRYLFLVQVCFHRQDPNPSVVFPRLELFL